MKHLQSLVRAFIAPQDYQFIRLSPNRRGRLYFYSRKRRATFSIWSRDATDSQVADQILTDSGYRLPMSRDRLDAQLDEIRAKGKTPLIIDCGAHIGISARYFAETYPDAIVVAVEPDQENMALAVRNCAGINNISLTQAAIGSTEGFASVVNPDSKGWMRRIARSEMSAGLPITTIPAIVAQYPTASLAIVKIDIEGFESDLFESNLDWIDSCPLIIIELHDWFFPGQSTSANFLRAIAGRARDFAWRGENGFSLRHLTRSTTES